MLFMLTQDLLFSSDEISTLEKIEKSEMSRLTLKNGIVKYLNQKEVNRIVTPLFNSNKITVVNDIIDKDNWEE